MDPLEELLGDAGVVEPATIPLKQRSTHQVVTDPNTELLNQLVREVRFLSNQVQHMQRALHITTGRHGDMALYGVDEIRSYMQPTPAEQQQLKGLKDLFKSIDPSSNPFLNNITSS